MDRQGKQQLVNDLHSIFESSKGVYIVHYHGLTVASITSLRARVAEVGSFRVIKNTLASLAAKGTVYEKLVDAGYFKGPTAICYSDTDPLAPAKILVDFIKENNNLKLVGAVVDEGLINVDGVKKVATLPTKDQIRATLIGVISAPATKVAQILQIPASQLITVLDAHSKKE